MEKRAAGEEADSSSVRHGSPMHHRSRVPGIFEPLLADSPAQSSQVSWVRHWEALLAMMYETLAVGLPPHHMAAAYVHGSW